MQGMTSMVIVISRSSKLPYILLTGGLSLLVAGLLFFMISVGLPQNTWTVLGGVCLTLGMFIMITGITCCYYINNYKQTNTISSHLQYKDETEAFAVVATDL